MSLFRARHDPDFSWVPLIFLAYVGFVFVNPIEHHAGWKEWTLTIAGVVTFLTLYLVAYLRHDWLSRWCVAGIVALGVTYLPFNGGAYAYFVFAGAFFGFIYEVRKAYKFLAGLFALILVESWLIHVSPSQFVFPLAVTGIVSVVNIHMAAKRRADLKLRLAKEEVEHLAKVAERERIARDLHDVLGHTLSVIVLKSELASKLLDRDLDRARQEITEVEHIAREALADVRQAIRGYRARGLAEEFAQAKATLETAGVRTESDTAEASFVAGRLSAAQETVLALVVREAVTNVVRHARASNCRIRLERGVGYYKLEVEDDGRGGFEEEGNGLRGMRERVEALDGTVLRDSSHGTRLSITIPLKARQEAIA